LNTTHIIIVNYNAGEWLSRAVNSALDNSDGLVTVVDNASNDQSVANAKAKVAERELSVDKRLQWIENKTNRGFAAANNQVLNSIKADYAVLMNPDCEINANTIPLILSAFQESSKIGLASCQILNQDGSLQATSKRRFPTPWSALVRMLQLHRIFPNNPKFADFDYGGADVSFAANADGKPGVEFVEAISGAFMVVSKPALEKVGLLDEAYFMHCEDLDWCKRFELAGHKVASVGGANVIHAKGVSSASRPIGVLWTLHKGMNRFFDKFYKQQYSLLIRYLVKFGIAASFVARASLALVKGIGRRFKGDA